jgi:hypothetical protein
MAGGEAQPLTVQPAKVAGPMNRLATSPAVSYARPAGAVATGYAVGLKQILAMVAALILAGGVLMPILSMWSFFGGAVKVSLLQISTMLSSFSNMSLSSSPQASGDADVAIFFFKYVGYFFFALALVAIVAALTRWYAGMWVAGIPALCVTLFMVIYYFAKLLSVSGDMHDAAVKRGPEAVTAMAKIPSIFAMAPLGWGALFLLIGAILLLTAATLEDPNMATQAPR